jgi:hypothetical protein
MEGGCVPKLGGYVPKLGGCLSKLGGCVPNNYLFKIKRVINKV